MLSMRKSVGLGLTLSLCAGFFCAVAAPTAPKLEVLQHWKLGGAVAGITLLSTPRETLRQPCNPRRCRQR